MHNAVNDKLGTKTTLLIGCFVLTIGAVSAVVVCLVAFAVAMEVGYFPDTVAKPRGMIPKRQLAQLRDNGIIEADEEVYYFYSRAMFSVLNEGNLFTDERVISYERDAGELVIYSATYNEIHAIDFEKSERWLDDSVITITLWDDDWFVLVVSGERRRDVAFYQHLREQWLQHRPDRRLDADGVSPADSAE